MMTEEQRYLFDLQGYLVLDGVLDQDQLQRMRAEMDARDVRPPEDGSNHSRFSDFLKWGDDWRNLIDHPAIMALLEEMLGPKFRLDHAYGMAMRHDPSVKGPGDLHHEAGMFHHGCYYVTHREKMHNGLVVVSFALTDAPAGAGGFHCIPGSHKVLYKTPPRFHDVRDNPLVRQVPMKAGDVLIFTEALTHGTAAWKAQGGERRSALLKYCPHYMQWAGKPMDDNIPGLTERQRLLLRGAYVWDRPAVELQDAGQA